MKFNRLQLVEYTEPKIRINGSSRVMAIFVCDCGNEKVYDFYSVKSGHTKQCIDCARKSAARSRKTHGLIKHPLYRKWQDMKNRCRNEKVDRYPSYGGRGISVCKEWEDDFQVYYDWCMANGWEKGLSVDRIDVDGNYEPSNCRIVTLAEQHYNKRNTYYVTIDGEKYSLSKLLLDNGLSHKYKLIWLQLKQGWKIERHIEKYNLKVK